MTVTVDALTVDVGPGLGDDPVAWPLVSAESESESGAESGSDADSDDDDAGAPGDDSEPGSAHAVPSR